MNPNNFYISLFASLLIVAAGCRHETAQRDVEPAPFTEVEDGTLLVREDLSQLLVFQKVSKSNIAAQIEGFGNATFPPGGSYAVRVPFDGIIESVDVEVGQKIECNQTLAILRSSSLAHLRGDIVRVAATLDAERDALEKRTQLVANGGGSIPERVVVEARAKVKSLEAELLGLQNGLKAAHAEETGGDKYVLRANRDGELLVRHIEPGENVETSDQEPAFLIGDPTHLIVKASFPERDAAVLKVDSPCRLFFPALGEQPFPGRVSALVPMIQTGSRTVQAICEINQRDTRLRASMAARVMVDIVGSDLLVVPRSAVLLKHDKTVVLVKCGENQVCVREVKIGANVGTSVQILSGIDEGDEVITENAVLLDGELDRLL
jgi:cobalt-zinc-cadmium efflux system membrane fusion protein